MIVSSKVDLVCWTGRVGLVCRDCREALTTGDAGGARRTSKRAAIEGPWGRRPFRDLRQLPRHHAGPFNDLRQRTYSERCDFRCGSEAAINSQTCSNVYEERQQRSLTPALLTVVPL